jgi:hypothetical protein
LYPKAKQLISQSAAEEQDYPLQPGAAICWARASASPKTFPTIIKQVCALKTNRARCQPLIRNTPEFFSNYHT